MWNMSRGVSYLGKEVDGKVMPWAMRDILR